MNASRDENNVPTILGTLESDWQTPIAIKANPATHGILATDGNTGSDNGPSVAPRDQNSVPALMAVSSADGVTPVAVYADADGNLLIDSN